MRFPISKSLREKVKSKFGGRCGYCGDSPKKLQIDHIKPVRSFHYNPSDANHEDNLMPACHSCNNYKAIHDLEQFRIELDAQLYRLNHRSVNFRLAKRFGLIKETPRKIQFYFEKDFE